MHNHAKTYVPGKVMDPNLRDISMFPLPGRYHFSQSQLECACFINFHKACNPSIIDMLTRSFLTPVSNVSDDRFSGRRSSQGSVDCEYGSVSGFGADALGSACQAHEIRDGPEHGAYPQRVVV
jgi:hypothetical protein